MPLGTGQLFHRLVVRVFLHAAQKVVLTHVGGVDDGLFGQQAHLAHHGRLFIILFIEGEGAGVFALAQMPSKRSQPGGRGRGLFITCFAGLFHFCKAVFHHLQIAQDELGVDGFDIAHRVHTALHMYDVCAVKTAHHMHKRVTFADIAKKFIA